MTLFVLLLGLALLVVGAELLVGGASRLAAAARIPPLVIGLTVVAFGTSAPELAVSLSATFRDQGDIALGNVVGSNIFNVLFILGISALVAPLVVSRQLVRAEVPMMILVCGLLWLLALDGTIGRVEGGALFAGIVLYTALLVRNGRRASRAGSGDAPAAGGVAAGTAAGGEPLRARTVVDVVIVLVGLTLLVLGSRWLVEGAVAIAGALGLSELVIGLTIVAAGTSMPELATSVIASVRGQRDIAVGNVVGSNVFNILCILGLSALAAPAGVPVSPAALSFDIPVMTAVAVACLPVFFTGHRIARWEGAVFLGYYLAYTAYLVLDATGHAAVPQLRAALLWFALPLTVITLVVLAVRARGAGTG
ncbi:MAG TPA: calcium/sodium antiporter [Longimicrobiales bacterium]|nr:calcium/sodium antiporter [Longimicrobiales bacterium]